MEYSKCTQWYSVPWTVPLSTGFETKNWREKSKGSEEAWRVLGEGVVRDKVGVKMTPNLEEPVRGDAENAQASVDGKAGESAGGNAMYEKLDALLNKVAVYSQFLAERLEDRIQLDRIEEKEAEEETKHAGKRKRVGDGKDAAQSKRRAKEEEKVEQACEASAVPRFVQPRLLQNVTLHPYQLTGVEWLVSLYENGLNGMLCDEMGLGKTVQAIGLLCYLRQMGVNGPFLVCAPLTVLPNWSNEVRRFAPSLNFVQYHGTKTDRTAKWNSILRHNKPTDEKFPLILTTYEILMRDRARLAKVPWQYVIVDEGHRMKNMNCKFVSEISKFRSANRLILTGTPLQNNLLELFSLLHFILPDIFDSVSAFTSWFDFDEMDNIGEEAIERERQNQLVSKLHFVLRPFVLRRMKRDVAQNLPRRKEILLYCRLTELQSKYYEAALKGTLGDLIEGARGGLVAGKQNKGLMNQLMQVRKACCHPFLFEEQETQWGTTDERIVTASGKLELLDRLLPRLQRAGHRVLLYSQFTSVLDILEDFLQLRQFGTVCRIDGDVGLESRIEQMKNFNGADPRTAAFVFLLSTRAGGLGINLVAADTVIFFDSDLNPQMDLQAMDRAHRIGQKRPVHVYRLITRNTIEEKLLEIAGRKRTLEHLVVAKGGFHRAPREEQDNDAFKDGVHLKPTDLRDLLAFNPVEFEAGKSSAGLIQDTELDVLLDRSDMMKGAQDEVKDSGLVKTSAFVSFEHVVR
ncbi:ATP-dependent DNA helicase DDM1 [Porphyridium purpureum]|uniref:ATP-dependent DNA helicase DDM1 n=1 Tax=Porphyridium purpureum TaxID=35688 RepID=A0A5J4YWU6_PORPP|nr:ATP-dependent DNA helicase DDM1 [Porphyridium purpureum]|eukprot:POR5261..scf209_3